MGRRLKVTVYVNEGAEGTKALLAGTEPTAEEAKGISNPDVWEDDGAVETSGEPPRGGPGASKEAWAAYAVSLGAAVPDDATRDEIITAVDAHRGG